MPKKNPSFTLAPAIIQTEQTSVRAVGLMQVESFMRDQEVAHLENGNRVGADAIADLRKKFREAWIQDFKTLAELNQD